MAVLALRRPISPAVIADGVVVAVLGVVLALQNVGETRFDTKLDLIEDPWAFLARGLNAWDPSAGFGQLQNQAYGYLFPMGPFFGVTHSLGMPAWVQQWLWAWLLVALAYLGMRLVARRLGLPWWAAMAGALAYALAPRIVTVLGPLSAEVLATALVPWVILPLLTPSSSVRRTAFRSAIPVLFMGAANATLTISVLIIPVVWILTRANSRLRLLGWWSGFVAALSLWWVVPLLIQGRYATPFLSFIESARDTTVGLSAGEALRGDAHWVAGIVEHGAPWWPAGYVLSTSGPVVFMTFALAGVGVAGIASARMPERLVNGLLLLIGLLLLAAGSLAAPFHAAWWELLDGVLAPFRNVHKFDPVLRFPLALGVAAACAAVGGGLARTHRGRPGGTWARTGGLAGVALMILVVAAPLVSPGIAAGTTWKQLPPWWTQAADWLGGQETAGRALLVPGSGFGQYLWGRTIDEPLQTLAPVPWVVDNSLPLGSLGSARVLDSISASLARGQETSGLANLLARSGIRYVIVRNDLDSERTFAPSRSVVSATLQKTPGLTWKAGFGDVDLGETPLTSPEYGRDGNRPALEIYEVSADVPMIDVMPVSTMATMTGGPEALLPALSEGLIGRFTPVVFADDSPPEAAGGLLIVGDSLLRRDRALGRGLERFSGVLTAEEGSRVTRRAGDLIPFDSPSYTVAAPRGVAYVTASTSQSFGDAIGALRTERQPFAALDNSRGTWWQSSSLGGPVGQWWEVGFLEPRNVEGLMLDIVDTALLGSTVTSVEWETDRGRGREPVARGGRVGPLRGDALEGVRYLRITAASAESDIGSFALRDVWMPGVRASQPLMTPMPPPSRGEATALQLVARESARPACVLVDAEVRCDPRASRPDGDGSRLDRLVTLRESLAGDLAMRGVVRPGKQAAELFEPLGLGVRATASSWLAQDPLVRPGAVLDGDPATAWVADLGDLSPALTLEWEVPRVLDGLRIRARDGGQAFAEPLSVRIRAGGTTIEADLGPDGSVSLPDVVATSLEIEITRWTPQTSVGLINDTSTPMPVHVGEVDVPALADLVYRPGALTRTGTLCGFGPDLSINGTVIETRVEATLQDILRGDEVSIVPCGSPRVSLPPGTHRITVEGTELVDPLSITIAPDGPVRAGDASGMLSADDRRSLDVREWGPTRRAAQLGPGPESIVRVAESANAGWQATLDGAPLAATRIDGWQQGWVVPEGRGGELVLAYAPQGQQVAGLVAGVVAIALAFIAGLIPVRFPRAYAPRALPSMRPVVGVGVVTAAAGVLAGIAGLVCALLAILLHRWRYVPVVAFAAVSIAGACWVLRWPAGAPDILAVFGVALASLTAITRPGGAGAGADTTSGPRRTDPPSDG